MALSFKMQKTALDFTDQCCFFIILVTIDINVPSTIGFYYHMYNLMTALNAGIVLCLTSPFVKLTMELANFLR